MEDLFNGLTASYKAKMRYAIQQRMPEMDEDELEYTVEVLGIGYESGLQTLYSIWRYNNINVDSPEKTI